MVLHDDKFIKYAPLEKNGFDTYGMKVRKRQKHFNYFHELFGSEYSDLYHDINYIVPKDKEVEELTENDLFGAGTIKIQIKDIKDFDDWVLYEFYIHQIIEDGPDKFEILTGHRRNLKLDALLK